MEMRRRGARARPGDAVRRRRTGRGGGRSRRARRRRDRARRSGSQLALEAPGGSRDLVLRTTPGPQGERARRGGSSRSTALARSSSAMPAPRPGGLVVHERQAAHRSSPAPTCSAIEAITRPGTRCGRSRPRAGRRSFQRLAALRDPDRRRDRRPCASAAAPSSRWPATIASRQRLEPRIHRPARGAARHPARLRRHRRACRA